MGICVEFFGLARQKVGVNEIRLSPAETDLSLACVLNQIALQYPALGSELCVDGRLHPSLAANLDGARFVSDPATPIRDGQHLLILSADAGG